MHLLSKNFPRVVYLEEDDSEALVEVFSRYFNGSIEEIKAAIEGSRVGNYDYSSRFLLGIKSSSGQKLQAASIVVQQRTKQHKVLEIVWFATSPECKGKGEGSYLFGGILEIAKLYSMSAVLVTSTNRALSFWMSRQNGHIGKTILRGKSRARIEDASLSPDEESNSSNHALVKKVVDEKRIIFAPLPRHSLLEHLYTDPVNRNRKGKITNSQSFTGAPYRYNIEESNHVWFLVAPQLKKYLACKAGESN